MHKKFLQSSSESSDYLQNFEAYCKFGTRFYIWKSKTQKVNVFWWKLVLPTSSKTLAIHAFFGTRFVISFYVSRTMTYSSSTSRRKMYNWYQAISASPKLCTSIACSWPTLLYHEPCVCILLDLSLPMYS